MPRCKPPPVIIKVPQDECECGDLPTNNYPKYYDSPEGCDIMDKVIVCSRYGFTTGAIFGAYDILLWSHARGYGSMFKRYMRHIVPLTLAGATFAIVANGLVRVRETNDAYNYVAGGVAVSPIIAAYLGSFVALPPIAVVLGIAGLVKKTAVDAHYSLVKMPDTNHMGTVDRWRWDLSLVVDPRDLRRKTCMKAPVC